MLRFFRREYPQVLILYKASHLDDASSGCRNDGRNLVADVELLDDVLHVVVHGALAQAEDLRDFIGCLASRGQLQNLQLSRRKVWLAGFEGLCRQGSGKQLTQVTGGVEHITKVLIQLQRTDRTVFARQADNAAQAALLMMERLGPAMLHTVML